MNKGQRGIVALLTVISALLPGCSVGMALSGQEDPDLSVLRAGETRGAIEMQFGSPVNEWIDDGKSHCLYSYTLGNEPSAGRALAHGAMDVLTLGLWEVVGTPIEAGAAKENAHSIMVVYDAEERVVSINRGAVKEEDDVKVETTEP